MVACLKCAKPAITFIRYSGAHLCREHFIDFFEKRVKAEFRRQCSLQGMKKIAIATSGGKDSTVLLFVLKKILGSRKNLELVSITVDEGIKGYRDRSIAVLKKNCKEWDVPHYVISFKDFFYEMDEIAKIAKDLSACSYCGVFRRYCLNKKSKELDAQLLIVGHNLDDTIQSILMNIGRGDIEKLVRIAPHASLQKGLVPRIAPLRIIPEKENYLYALLNKINFYRSSCPYAELAIRNLYRKIIYELESHSPGTRHAILKTHDSIIEALRKSHPQPKLKKCEICKEPTTQAICRACELGKRIKVAQN
ncbi:MAG: TIGR00269 family protein [Candidatus Thermoplasmatota archaeon]|nr:TIGR00269 family protein [Candidatus Thermoplasmatota archaeon]